VGDFLLQLVIWAGPLGLFGGWIWIMIAKKGWTWSQLIAAMIFTLLLASAVPTLPQAVNNGVTGIVTSFTSNK
jgi:hypothetical protein